MCESKSVSLPLGAHFILLRDKSLANEEEEEYMSKVPYFKATGSVIYLMVCTRPDLAYAISTLSRFMINPGPIHWEMLKWLLRYLRGTFNIGLVHKHHSDKVRLKGFMNSDYAGDRDNRKFTSSYVLNLCDSYISWKS